MATAKYKKNYRGVYSTMVWDGTYDSNGVKHRIRLTSDKSSRDLENLVNDFNNKVKNSEVTSYSNLSFQEYAYKWLETSKSLKEENTQAMYRNIIKVHLAIFNHLPVTDFTHSHFQQLINHSSEHPRTCEQIYLTVRQIIKFAIRSHVLPKNSFDNICGDISLPKKQKTEKRPLTNIEKQAFADVKLDDRKLAFLNILYYCGLRRGEVLALQPDDFDWDKQEVTINKVIIFDRNTGTPKLKNYPKTDNSIRKVPVPDNGVKNIKPFAQNCTDLFLFHGNNSEMMTLSAFIRMWQSIILSMNIAAGYNPNAKKDRIEKPITNLTAHIFRHNYCTELCYKVPQISTKMIAKLMGDTEKMVLDVYSHIIEEKEDITGTLNQVF